MKDGRSVVLATGAGGFIGRHLEPVSWMIQRKVLLPAGCLAAIRVVEGNKSVLDFVLLPATEMIGSIMKLSERTRFRADLIASTASMHQFDRSAV